MNPVGAPGTKADRHIEIVAHWGNVVGDFLLYPAVAGNSEDAAGYDARIFALGERGEVALPHRGSRVTASSRGVSLGFFGPQALGNFVMHCLATKVRRSEEWGIDMEEDGWDEIRLDLHALRDVRRLQIFARNVHAEIHQCVECGSIFTDDEMEGRQYEPPPSYPVAWPDDAKQGDPEEKLIQVATGFCDDCHGLVYRAGLDAQPPPVISFTR